VIWIRGLGTYKTGVVNEKVIQTGRNMVRTDDEQVLLVTEAMHLA
jgi:hypothetical protein